MELSAIALTRLEQAQTSLEQTASRIARIAAPTTDGQPVDTVDLSTAAVDLLAARQEFAANLKVIETADGMERQTLDLLA